MDWQVLQIMNAGVLRFLRVGASDESIQLFHLVRKAMREQKIQGAIHNGRLRPEPLGGKVLENIIGTEGLMLIEQKLQNAPPCWRQPKLLLRTSRLRHGEQGGFACIMIVRTKSNHVYVISFQLPYCNVITLHIHLLAVIHNMMEKSYA